MNGWIGGLVDGWMDSGMDGCYLVFENIYHFWQFTSGFIGLRN